MYRSQLIATVRSVPVRAHWTAIFIPIALMVWQYVQVDVPSAALVLAICLALFSSFLFQAMMQCIAARLLGVGVRDITLLPVSAIVRLTWISEKPTPELGIYAVGILARALVVGLCFGLLKVYGWPVAIILDFDSLDGPLFCNRLFWIAVAMLIVDCVPVFPTSAGFFFRAALAMTAKRIRATEITAHLGTFVCLLCVGVGFGFFWMKNPALPLLGIYFLVWSQQELADVRYFTGMKQRKGQAPTPAMLLPEDQVIDLDCRPTAPNFTGFTFNPRTKLWIEWKNGEPISANALIGQ